MEIKEVIKFEVDGSFFDTEVEAKAYIVKSSICYLVEKALADSYYYGVYRFEDVEELIDSLAKEGLKIIKGEDNE